MPDTTAPQEIAQRLAQGPPLAYVSDVTHPHDDVNLLRRALHARGHREVNPTLRSVSTVVLRALVAEQQRLGLAADGVCGPKTWGALARLAPSAVIPAPQVPAPPAVIPAPQVLAKHLANIDNPAFHAKAYRAGRARVKSKANPASKNACGAVSFEYFLAAGVLPRWHWVYGNAQGLADVLEANTLAQVDKALRYFWDEARGVKPTHKDLGLKQAPGLTRHPALEMRKGDLAVCGPKPGRTRSAHVAICADRIRGHYYALDNQRTKPYERNIGKGQYTYVAYVLRLPGGSA